jgi:hypothetical protein
MLCVSLWCPFLRVEALPSQGQDTRPHAGSSLAGCREKIKAFPYPSRPLVGRPFGLDLATAAPASPVSADNVGHGQRLRERAGTLGGSSPLPFGARRWITSETCAGADWSSSRQRGESRLIPRLVMAVSGLPTTVRISLPRPTTTILRWREGEPSVKLISMVPVQSSLRA